MKSLLSRRPLQPTDATITPLPGEIALDEIYTDISQMEKKELEERLMTQYEERSQYILPLAILFLVVEVLISERRRTNLSGVEQ